jgi:hypothetical protein
MTDSFGRVGLYLFYMLLLSILYGIAGFEITIIMALAILIGEQQYQFDQFE